MCPAIAVIGTGVIGCRHLQALASLHRLANVYAVDKDPLVLRQAADLFKNSAPSNCPVDLIPTVSLDELPADIDVAVISTDAEVRRAVVERLLETHRVRYLVLEKFLFQCEPDYEAVGKLLAEKGVRAWVNCGRRLWPFYRELRDRLIGEGPVACRYSTHVRYGIATTAIHILDVLAFLTNESKFTLSGARLDPSIVNARREGYVEFTGTLLGSGDSGHWFEYTAHARGSAPLLFQIETATMRIIAEESSQTAWISAEKDGWGWRDIPLTVKLQSELTNLVVEEILDRGTCGLCEYWESARLHQAILTPLLHHDRLHRDSKADICPIT